MLAAQHGKHVLVEKPMARNVTECEEMIAACAAAGVKLGVCYRRRTFPQVVRAKELVAEGAIGEVLTVRTHCSALQDTLKSDRAVRSPQTAAHPTHPPPPSRQSPPHPTYTQPPPTNSYNPVWTARVSPRTGGRNPCSAVR